MMLAVGLSYMAFIMSRYVSSMHTFWRVFFFLIINRCWILGEVFFCFYCDDHLFFILNLLMWWSTLIDLCILKNPCIPGINPTWSWCIILFMYCWIQFASILLRSLCLCSSVILAGNFLFLVIYLSGFSIRSHRMNAEVFLPLQLFLIVW